MESLFTLLQLLSVQGVWFSCLGYCEPMFYSLINPNYVGQELYWPMPRLKCYHAIEKSPENTYYEELTEVRMNASLINPTFKEVILVKYSPTPVKQPLAPIFLDSQYLPDRCNDPWGMFALAYLVWALIWLPVLDNYDF